jgi:hypothetical protein
VDDRDNVSELGLKHRVEVCGRRERGQAVAGMSDGGNIRIRMAVMKRGPHDHDHDSCRHTGTLPAINKDLRVGELGEDTDVGRVLELATWTLAQRVRSITELDTHGQPWWGM